MFAFLGLVGVLLWRSTGQIEVARIAWGVGATAAALYYAVPPLRRTMFVGWMYAFYPVGWMMSHLALALIYFAIVTPIGLIRRTFGRDPMQRRLDKSAATYWVEHEPVADINRYFRQF
jgi:hypothetical protein